MPQDVLTIGSVRKTEDDVIRVYCDFGNIQEVISLLTDANGDYDPDATAFTSQTVTTSGTGAPTLSGVQLDYNYQLSAKIAGGDPGNYGITFKVILGTLGIVISRTGNLEIVEP